jgi:hypothetical protein
MKSAVLVAALFGLCNLAPATSVSPLKQFEFSDATAIAPVFASTADPVPGDPTAPGPRFETPTPAPVNVPEPRSAALVLFGLAGLWMFHRLHPQPKRRRRRVKIEERRMMATL